MGKAGKHRRVGHDIENFSGVKSYEPMSHVAMRSRPQPNLLEALANGYACRTPRDSSSDHGTLPPIRTTDGDWASLRPNGL